MDGTSRLDGLARDLANGQVSRRTALRRLLGGGAALALPRFLVADSALAKCPPSRKCGSKCCPSGQHCKHGKCKCKGGLTKCGKKCVDVGNDPANCGSCGHACASSQTCVAGYCSGGGSSGGDDTGTTPGAVCGNGVRETGEICDGADLGGATCQSLGFLSGALACAANCTYDTSGCVAPSCSTAADCPQGPAGDCQRAVCNSGTCGFVADNTDLPADDGSPCTTEVCSGGVPSHPAKPQGTSCGSGQVCSASGACVACVDPSNCPQPSNPYCAAATCSSNVCGFSYQPNGTGVYLTVDFGSGPTSSRACFASASGLVNCNGSGHAQPPGGGGPGGCPSGTTCLQLNPPYIVDGQEWGVCH